MTSLFIKSIAYQLPDRLVPSAEVDGFYQAESGHTEKYVGIRSRYYFDKMSVLQGGALAAQKALQQAGISWKEVDCLVAASATKWRPIPCMAASLKQELGLAQEDFPCFDIDSTCLGFMVALEHLACCVQSGKYKNILIVCAEKPSAVLNWQQPQSACLFGDMAAAVVLGPGEGNGEILFSSFTTYPQGAEFARIKGGLMGQLALEYTAQNHTDYLFDMNGRSIYKVSAKVLPDMMKDAFSQTGLDWQDIKMVVPHQASPLAMTLMCKKLGIPAEKMMRTIEEYGNNVSASIPFAFAKAVENGQIKRGDKVMLIGTSAGLSVGVMIVEY